jgi:membrane protease YdiL (CAAX protease family)
MASESKSFPEVLSYAAAPAHFACAGQWSLWLQIGLVYTLIVVASWTPEGPWKAGLMLATACLVVVFALGGRYTAREMGLGLPSARGTLLILGLGLLLALSIPVVATLAGLRFPPVRVVPWRGAWQYAVWALVQQFALQSFFYVRMESLVGSRRAVLAAAVLFSSVHLPSPVLTIATLMGGFFFCEMFRRYRSILPLGIVHAALGLTIAASFSDHLLHHMRVGIGYLAFHR